MNKFFNRVTSAVKGQFVTIPLDEPQSPEQTKTTVSDSSSRQLKSKSTQSANPSQSKVGAGNERKASASSTTKAATESADTKETKVAEKTKEPNDDADREESPVRKMLSMLPKGMSSMFGGEKGTAKEAAKLLDADDIEKGRAGVKDGSSRNANKVNSDEDAQSAASTSIFGSWFGAKQSDAEVEANSASVESAAESGGLASWLNPMSIMKTREPNLSVLLQA